MTVSTLNEYTNISTTRYEVEVKLDDGFWYVRNQRKSLIRARQLVDELREKYPARIIVVSETRRIIPTTA